MSKAPTQPPPATLRLLTTTGTCMSGQLTAHTHVPFTSFQIVNGANVIQATAGHIVPRRGICTGHDPRGTQRDGVHLNDRTQMMQTCSSSTTLTVDSRGLLLVFNSQCTEGVRAKQSPTIF